MITGNNRSTKPKPLTLNRAAVCWVVLRRQDQELEFEDDECLALKFLHFGAPLRWEFVPVTNVVSKARKSQKRLGNAMKNCSAKSDKWLKPGVFPLRCTLRRLSGSITSFLHGQKWFYKKTKLNSNFSLIFHHNRLGGSKRSWQEEIVDAEAEDVSMARLMLFEWRYIWL